MSALAQRDMEEDTKPPFKDRIYFGGGGGFSGGTDAGGNRFFVWSISPVVGYMITPKFSAGSGFVYQNLSYSDVNLTLEQWGFMPFVRYNFDAFYVTSEFQYIKTPSFFSTESRFYTRLLFGAGYMVPLGGRARLNAQGMYDVIYRNNGPFASPWVFRVFFSF